MTELFREGATEPSLVSLHNERADAYIQLCAGAMPEKETSRGAYRPLCTRGLGETGIQLFRISELQTTVLEQALSVRSAMDGEPATLDDFRPETIATLTSTARRHALEAPVVTPVQ